MTDRLGRLKKETGPKGMLYFTGSGTKGLLNGLGMEFWRLFGGCTTTYGDLCWPSGLEATRLTLGENKHNAPWDLGKARLIVLWGKNPAETHIHQMDQIHDALDNGARLVVIDPRRTPSSERAELLIQPKPGTDGALALALAHVLVSKGWIDEDYMERHVLGFAPFKERVSEFSPEKTASIVEVKARYIHELAELMGTIKPFTLCAGYGMQRYSNSGQTMRALLALPAITGNIGRKGGGWIYANLQSHIFDSVKDPLASYPPARPDKKVRVALSTARLGREMQALKDPPLRMAWVERGNPVAQNPDTHGVLAAFRGLSFRVVVEQFLTDTAREADIILPAKTFLEQTDVITAYWHPYIQIKQKVLDPPGEVKPESEIYRLLAERLGFPREAIESTFPEPTDEGVEAYLRRRLTPFPEITLEKLKEGPLLPPGHEEVVFSDGKFPTPSGKIELYSEEAFRRWGLDPLPSFKDPLESLTPLSRYRLYLMTPNTKNRIHSQFNNLEMIRAVSSKPIVTINGEDAQVRGIAHGDRVRVFNDRGNLSLEAHLDFSLKKGCVSVTNGWWMDEGGAVNLCSLGRETDMGHGAAFHDNLVEVERLP